MSEQKKILLSITNLKKYFPVAKTSIFQREQFYVRANENISLDIYEGETIGIVGESGCGKSTLGRVILQLYDQTAGNTIYYGKTRDDLTPKYVIDTIKHSRRYRKKYRKAKLAREKEEQKVAEAGGEEKADFFALQSLNLARCEEKTRYDNIVKIFGGFFALEDGTGIPELKAEYKALSRRNKLKKKLDKTETDLRHETDRTERRSDRKIARLTQKSEALRSKLASAEEGVAKARADLTALRTYCAGKPGFAEAEAERDEGTDLSRLRYNEMRFLRKDMQIIFQDPYSSLNPRFTIGQIIEEGLVTHDFYRHGSPKMREHIVNTMVECGLQEYMLYRYPHQFSGGQRQRISIARALAVHPKFIVCDECVSALDVSIQSQIINLLQELKEKEQLTYMFISHDLSVVKYISDRICVMYLGSVVELADSATIFKDPRHPYTVALLSSIPTTDIESLDRDRIILEGNIPSPIKPPSGCKFHTRCYMACDKCKRVPPPLREIEPGHFVACHFPERKIDENGNYLFDLPDMEKKSKKAGRSEDEASGGQE